MSLHCSRVASSQERLLKSARLLLQGANESRFRSDEYWQLGAGVSRVIIPRQVSTIGTVSASVPINLRFGGKYRNRRCRLDPLVPRRPAFDTLAQYLGHRSSQ